MVSVPPDTSVVMLARRLSSVSTVTDGAPPTLTFTSADDLTTSMLKAGTTRVTDAFVPEPVRLPRTLVEWQPCTARAVRTRRRWRRSMGRPGHAKPPGSRGQRLEEV